jgi:hypothetical protein
VHDDQRRQSEPDEGQHDLEHKDLTASEPLAPTDVLGSTGLGKQSTLIEWTRVGLAASLVLLLAVLTLGAGWYTVHSPQNEPQIEAFLKLVFTPVIGLVGSVVGFFFGSLSARDNLGGG